MLDSRFAVRSAAATTADCVGVGGGGGLERGHGADVGVDSAAFAATRRALIAVARLVERLAGEGVPTGAVLPPPRRSDIMSSFCAAAAAAAAVRSRRVASARAATASFAASRAASLASFLAARLRSATLFATRADRAAARLSLDAAFRVAWRVAAVTTTLFRCCFLAFTSLRRASALRAAPSPAMTLAMRCRSGESGVRAVEPPTLRPPLCACFARSRDWTCFWKRTSWASRFSSFDCVAARTALTSL